MQVTFFIDRAFRVYEDIVRERIEKDILGESTTRNDDDVTDAVEFAWAFWEADVEKTRREADDVGLKWFLLQESKDWRTPIERVMDEFGMEKLGDGYGWKSERRGERWEGEFESRKGTIHVTIGWLEKGGSVSGSVNFCRPDGESWPMSVRWMFFCEEDGRGVLQIESEVYFRFSKIAMRVVPDDMKLMPITTNMILNFDLQESRREEIFVWKGDLQNNIDFEQKSQKSICIDYIY